MTTFGKLFVRLAEYSPAFLPNRVIFGPKFRALLPSETWNWTREIWSPFLQENGERLLSDIFMFDNRHFWVTLIESQHVIHAESNI